MFKTQALNARIYSIVLRLAASKGWGGVTLQAVAKEVKIPLATFRKRFASENEIIPLIIEEITHQARKDAGRIKGSRRDVLFEYLMARFDILQQHRKAIASIADAARHDHALACVLARAVMESMAQIADVAKLNVPRAIAAAGLSVIYGFTFLAWRKDKSRDMAKTMAALDKGLRLSEKAAAIIKQNF